MTFIMNLKCLNRPIPTMLLTYCTRLYTFKLASYFFSRTKERKDVCLDVFGITLSKHLLGTKHPQHVNPSSINQQKSCI